MEKTFKKDHLDLIANVLADAKSAREGKLTSFMLTEDDAKKVTVFSVGPEHNCRIVFGKTESENPNAEFFTFQPEDIDHGIRNSEGHVTLTVQAKEGNMKFRSNKREAYRVTEIAEEHIRTRLKIFDSAKGQLLFKIRPNEILQLFNAMTIGSDTQSTKTTFTRLRLQEPTKLEFYKYSTDSTAIFGYVTIEEGNITHPALVKPESNNSFYIPEMFPVILRTIMKNALKDEGGRLIDVYFNGNSITLNYVTDQDAEITMIFDGAGSDTDNVEMINKMATKFTSKFGTITMNTTAFGEVLKDIEATTGGAACFMEFKDGNANIESATQVNNTPIYSNVITEVRSEIEEEYTKAHPNFKLPLITSPFRSILDTYKKFDSDENDQLTLHLYQLITKSAEKQTEAILIEMTTDRFTGRLVAQIC